MNKARKLFRQTGAPSGSAVGTRVTPSESDEARERKLSKLTLVEGFERRLKLHLD